MAAMSGTTAAERSRGAGHWSAVLGAVAVVVLITAGIVWLQSDSDVQQSDVARPGVSADALSPAGTPLPDGFAVPEGADLVGTPVQYGFPDSEATREWQALLLVDDDPIATWSALLGRIGSVLGVELDAGTAGGCGVNEGRLQCFISRGGASGPEEKLSITAELLTVPGDVTGHYTIRLLGERIADPYENPIDPWPGGDPPPAPGARPRPDIGEPLVLQGLAQGSEPRDYPLLEGSELLVQYSPGSLTGGFGVLLRILPGADVDAVGRAYAEQGSQYDGAIDERLIEADNATVTVYVPPGGAGGYQATVYAVDNASGRDYVYYELFND